MQLTALHCTATPASCLATCPPAWLLSACGCWYVQLGGQWASGRPFLHAKAKQTDTPWDAGLALPLVALDVSDLKVGRRLRGMLRGCLWSLPGHPLQQCTAARLAAMAALHHIMLSLHSVNGANLSELWGPGAGVGLCRTLSFYAWEQCSQAAQPPALWMAC